MKQLDLRRLNILTDRSYSCHQSEVLGDCKVKSKDGFIGMKKLDIK